MNLKAVFLEVFIFAAFSTACFANPTGGVVAAGSATIQANGTVLTVSSTSSNAIINWQGFSIAANETTRFLQPSASAAVLNRVVTSAPSTILGNLTSNGAVFLINPNGMIFGAGSQVSTASFAVSTGDLTDANFLAGNMNFGAPGSAGITVAGMIETTGTLTVNAGGNVSTGGTLTFGGGTFSTPGQLTTAGSLTTTGGGNVSLSGGTVSVGGSITTGGNVTLTGPLSTTGTGVVNASSLTLDGRATRGSALLVGGKAVDQNLGGKSKGLAAPAAAPVIRVAGASPPSAGNAVSLRLEKREAAF